MGLEIILKGVPNRFFEGLSQEIISVIHEEK